ncbi:MAG: histidine triad nucleotide-binding protein [Patescibacteria group bacterium]
MDCIFCQIVKKEIPAQIVYEDEEIMAFKDIHPKAKIHLLIIPKEHIPSLAKAKEKEILGKLLWQAKILAEKFEIDQSGYKIIINTGEDAGQLVFHLHLHLLGGEKIESLV